MFKCQPVDLDYLENAPFKFVNTVELNAKPEQVFKLFEDPDAWPKWYKELRHSSRLA